MSMAIRESLIEDGVLERFVLRSWESHRHQFFPVGESRTIQSERDLTDINNIVAKYQRTGQLPLETKQRQYGDVSELNRPLGELIQESRETLDAAGRALDAKQKDIAEKAAAAAAAEKAELEELRKLKASMTPQQ